MDFRARKIHHQSNPSNHGTKQLAACIATLGESSFAPARWFSRLYVMLFQGTPLLVQIFVIYYGFGQISFLRSSFAWPLLAQAYWCAILTLSLNTSAYGAEIIRGAITAVPEREIEAGRAIGMAGLLLRHRVIWPQALRYGLANYGNEAILLLKATSLASVITLMDVTGLAYRLVSKTYRSEEIFTVAGLIYLAMTFVIATCVHMLERHLAPVAGSDPDKPSFPEFSWNRSRKKQPRCPAHPLSKPSG